MSESIQLGPFVLDERVGEGGMGAVYRAVHAGTGQDVALKVLSGEVARRSDKQRGFRREVQALAKLHHPAIASVLAYGEIDRETAARGPDPFVAGAPWFAMEYVEGAPVPRQAREWRWEDLKSVLLTTLDALSHAHARSIVHRDLKADNILLRESAGDHEAEVKLVDFGVARIFDPAGGGAEEMSGRVMGTPMYMAPEHIRGNWRDQGPWTDLYALGCLIWRTVCRTPAFDGETTTEVLEAHLQHALPAFEPDIPVPPEFEGWLRNLLHTDIDRRTTTAADAAWQLLQLDDPEPSVQVDVRRDRVVAEVQSVDSHPTLHGLAETVTETTPVEDLPDRDQSPTTTGGDEGRRSESSGPSSREHPPVLPDWRRGGGERTAAVVPKAGLQLFALRDVPVVDRRRERDRMWGALRRVAAEKHPALVVLEGGVGTGKSRLARWLGRRAEETGAARVLRAAHGPSSALDAGLRQMVRSAFRTRGLSREEVYERLLQRLPALEEEGGARLDDARALTEFLRPTDDDVGSVEGPRFRFANRDQKQALLQRLLARWTQERPLVVWFDDLHRGPGAVAMLEHLFAEAGESLPVLAVATVREDLVEEDPDVGERLESLYDRAGAERVETPPLARPDHRTLVDRLLHLDDELADAIADRTEGNPLLAVQSLQELVEGERLAEGEEGYVLDEDESLEVLEGVRGLWNRRLKRLVGDVDADSEETVWQALERAAALGREVEAREWQQVGDELGLERPGALADMLVERGLADRTEGGWAFAHELLVRRLERRARDRGRWRTHHRRCADMLEELPAERSARTAARRADHWMEANEPERALAPLFEQAQTDLESGESVRARRALERRRDVLDRLAIPGSDPRAIQNAVELARCRLLLGSAPDSVISELEGAVERAANRPEDRLEARGLHWVATCRRMMGEYDGAIEAAREATRLAERADATEEVVNGLMQWGWTEFVRGRPDEAETRFERAAVLARDGGYLFLQRAVEESLAHAVASQGETSHAADLFVETLEATREEGFRTVEMDCLNGLGEIARFEGDAGSARDRYQAYLEVARETHRKESVAEAHLNLAQVELMADRPAAAKRHRREAARIFEEVGRKSEFARSLKLVQMVRLAGEGDWDSYEDLFSTFAGGWPEEASLSKDHPWLLEMAGDRAADAGERDRADRAWRLARDLAERLDNAEARERLGRKMTE